MMLKRIIDKLKKGLQSPLARKQLLAILVFSSIITLIDTSIQLYIEFNGDIGFVKAQLDQIEQSHLKSLVSSLWRLDDEQINIQLNNALSLRDITYLEIREEDHAAYTAGIRSISEHRLSRSYNMDFDNGYIKRHIGTLYVEADLSGVYSRLYKRTLFILTAQGIKTFVVSFFILFIVHHMVTRHLITLAGFMRQVKVESFDTSLSLNRKRKKSAKKDELDEVVSTIDDLRNAINYYIDKQETVEKALRKSESKFRTFAEQAIIGVCIIHDGQIIFSNEGLSRIFGYSIKEFPDIKEKKIFSLFHDDDRHTVKWLYNANLNGIGNSVEVRAMTHDGSEKWVQLFSKPFQGEDGLTLYCIIVDTTQRRLYENEMTKFKTITDKANYGATIVDPEGRVIYTNECFCLMHGYREDELTGQPISMVYPEDHKNRAEDLKKMLLEKGHYSAELVVHIKKDGNVFPTLMNENLIRDKQGRPLFISGTTIDVTEMRRLEEQLKHAHKMEAIGTLAGGIAHDFNNILGIVLGNAELAQQWIPEDSPAFLNLKEIVTASNRAKGVVKQLLNFSRKSDDKQEPLQINYVVKETVNLLRASIPKTITIRYMEEDDLPSVMGNSTQIHQILINLCTNASHAMEKNGGILSISLSRYEVNGKPETETKKMKPGHYVCITIRDSGEGIPEPLLDKVFVPYFTTKETGKGTGMGLAVVHGLVKNHGGDIELSSKVGQGTVVHIYFPAHKLAPKKEACNIPDLPKGTERILFVDDEVSLVNIVKEILERFGYQVDAFENPIEALENFKVKHATYDLIITDMSMPHMTGDQFIKNVFEIRRTIPVVLCTGYNDDLTDAKARDMGLKAILSKPVNMRELVTSIRDVLDMRSDFKD